MIAASNIQPTSANDTGQIRIESGSNRKEVSMAYLSSIIHDIQNHFQVRIQGEYNPKQTIDGIRFLNDNDTRVAYLLPNVLYLASYPLHGSHTLYGDVLFVGCEDKKPQGNALYIAEALELIELYNIMEHSVLAYHRVQVQKETLFKALHSGKGLEALIKSAHKFLANPIVVCDSSYAILASYPEVSDVRNLEFRNNRLSVKAIYTENMKEANITDYMYHSIYPIVTKVEDFPYDWVFESIRIKRAVVGYICIRCLEQSPTEEDLEIIHFLTQLISIQLQKDDSYNNPHGIKYDLFLKDLFLRRFENEATARRHLELLGVRPNPYYYLIACSFKEQAGQLLASNYYWQQICVIFENSITGLYGNHFVTLLSTSHMDLSASAAMERFETFLSMNHMTASVSYVFDSLMEGSAYFEQCINLLSQKLAIQSENSIFYYGDHYMKHMISLANRPRAIRATIHPAIRFMKRYDEENHTEYLNTLYVYFKQNRNAPATAKALFIHKSTLFYRFEKIEKLFQLDLGDPDTLFACEHSLRILDLIG
ncbi:MAG: helix-turn-helix domain-containing protein [Eubacteriales bacterium]|nr:helix-turn-helix domain-containing protein [Eubacteriales bacterium]